MNPRKWIVALATCALLTALLCVLFMPTKRVAKASPIATAQGPQTQSAVSVLKLAQTLPVASTANVASAAAQPSSSHLSAVPPPPASAGKLVLNDSGANRSFSIAMDELVRKSPNGIEESVAVPAQTDMAGLRDAWSDLQKTGGGEIFLVAYEDGVARTPQTRRLITPKIRVELKPGEDLAQTIPGAVEVTRPDYAPGFAVVRMPDSFAAMDVLPSVRSLGGVQQADVLLAHQQSKRSLPNDPLIGSQWHLKNTGQSGGVAGTDIDVEPVWNYSGSGLRGAGIVVGLVDDGLQTTHPDLAANVRTDIDHDWDDNTPNDPNPVAGDDNNHGTCCAGNVAAIANNAIGVSGSAPEAKVVGLRLIAAAEGDQEESEAMAWDNDLIQIKSNSWGPNDDGMTLEGPGPLTQAALKTATTSGRGGHGTIFVWAGGNGGDELDNSNYDGYANSIYTIAIGAITNTRQQSWYSEPGANLVAAGPSSGDESIGELDITTIDRVGTDGYNTKSGTAGNYATDFGGTSSATPTVAGVIALILQRNANLGWRDVQEILVKSSLKVNPADTEWTTNSVGYHFSHKFGAGLVDANAAVAQAASWTNLGAQTSAVSTQSGLNVAIPDNDATGITRTFDLTASKIRVEQVTVRVTITHRYRGDLAITLTSPTGVQSRLAEVHNDTASNYSDWTFMTTHDWGERSTGTWTLKIADGVSGGTGSVNAAELTVFGSAAAAGNPGPIVRISSPDNLGHYGGGATLQLTALAQDFNASGAAGVVSRVDFYSGSKLVGSASSAPYLVNWKPKDGVYTLTARGVDSEGAVGSSATVNVTVGSGSASVPTIQISKKTIASSGKKIVIHGKVTGVGSMTLKATNRTAVQKGRIGATGRFVVRMNLFKGKNIIILKVRDSRGESSRPKRVVVTRH